MAYLPLDLSNYTATSTNCILTIDDNNGQQEYLFHYITTTVTVLDSGRVQIHDENGSFISLYPSQMVDLGLTVDGLTNNVASCQSINSNIGFADYNDNTGDISLTADTWTDVPNDKQGAFTNVSYLPSSISSVLDEATGYLDFSELTLGSQLLIRNDFTITPNTNNSLLEVRYLLGQGVGEYALKFWSERLDNGSGIGYQRVVSFPIYMGDTNTQGGVGRLQVKLSTNGTLNNAGSYIKIDLK